MQSKFKINGERWTIRIGTSADLRKHRKDGDHLAALCVPSEKLILVEEGSLDLVNLTHEIFHAYFSYLYLEDADLKLNDLEEIMATFFSVRGEEMLKKAKRQFKTLQKIKEQS